jgi:hypothetical protein
MRCHASEEWASPREGLASTPLPEQIPGQPRQSSWPGLSRLVPAMTGNGVRAGSSTAKVCRLGVDCPQPRLSLRLHLDRIGRRTRAPLRSPRTFPVLQGIGPINSLFGRINSLFRPHREFDRKRLKNHLFSGTTFAGVGPNRRSSLLTSLRPGNSPARGTHSPTRNLLLAPHSHSIVPGGFDVTS